MAHASLSPGFVKLRYTGFTYTHIQTIPVDIVGAAVVGVEPSFASSGAGTLTMSEFIDEYVALLKPLFGSTVTIVDAEYWDMPTPESNPYWVYTYAVGEVGTNATASVPERQHVVSFRTSAGGIAFNYLMEVSGGFAGSLRQNFPTSSSGTNALAAYLTGSTSCFRGRDGGQFVVPIWFTTKNNDAIRKKSLNL